MRQNREREKMSYELRFQWIAHRPGFVQKTKRKREEEDDENEEEKEKEEEQRQENKQNRTEQTFDKGLFVYICCCSGDDGSGEE